MCSSLLLKKKANFKPGAVSEVTSSHKTKQCRSIGLRKHGPASHLNRHIYCWQDIIHFTPSWATYLKGFERNTHLFQKYISFCKHKICSDLHFSSLSFSEQKSQCALTNTSESGSLQTCNILSQEYIFHVLIHINKARQRLNKLRVYKKCRGRYESNKTEHYELFRYTSGLWEGLVLCRVMCLRNAIQRAKSWVTECSDQQEESPLFWSQKNISLTNQHPEGDGYRSYSLLLPSVRAHFSLPSPVLLFSTRKSRDPLSHMRTDLGYLCT